MTQRKLLPSEVRAKNEAIYYNEMLAFIEKVMDAKTEVSAKLRIEAAELIEKARG